MNVEIFSYSVYTTRYNRNELACSSRYVSMIIYLLPITLHNIHYFIVIIHSNNTYNIILLPVILYKSRKYYNFVIVVKKKKMATRMTRESIKYRVYPWKIRNEDDDNNNNITGATRHC